MFVLLLVLIVVMFTLGFHSPVWWLIAGVLVFGVARNSRDRGGGWGRGSRSDLGEYRDYQDRRHRQEQWDRRYRRQHRARWRREDRRDSQRHGGDG
ncbi:hypothetical protein [Streptomyces sp. NBC_00687]|uniref:hypothetical protein n=1 Tax=Streptomyces sp. NBC_00687 TaxID=2975807 RepID=UPI0022577826|nr:hypothetical protein [Streptomyces sp. NBC_00687]MCX4918125.1 hypothetical protein [Streptomyces sp. NBC_00687]